jgi:hypothetical protein
VPPIGASYVALACVRSRAQIRSYGAAYCNVMLTVEGVANGEDKAILVSNQHMCSQCGLRRPWRGRMIC